MSTDDKPRRILDDDGMWAKLGHWLRNYNKELAGKKDFKVRKRS